MNIVYVVEFEFDRVRYLDAVFNNAEKADAYVRERGFALDPLFITDVPGEYYQACYLMQVSGIYGYDYDAGYAWVSGREVQ